MGCYAVAAMLEEPPSVACRHHVESSAHRLYERLAGTRPGPPQERLELGKRFFYGVEIGPLRIRSIVRRETSKYRATSPIRTPAVSICCTACLSIILSIPSASGNRRSRPARRRYVLLRLPWAQGPRDLGALAVHRGGGAKTARPRHLVCGRQPQRRPLAVRRTVAGAYRHHRDPGAARRNRPRHAADPTLDAPRRL